MPNLTKVATMTSLEIVELLNSSRNALNRAPIRHANFMAKVRSFFGDYAEQFYTMYVSENNVKQPCYRFPKRESVLMAASYEADIAMMVYDRMIAAEEDVDLLKTTLKEVTDKAEALILDLSSNLTHTESQLQFAIADVQLVERQHSHPKSDLNAFYASCLKGNHRPPLNTRISDYTSTLHLLSEARSKLLGFAAEPVKVGFSYQVAELALKRQSILAESARTYIADASSDAENSA